MTSTIVNIGEKYNRLTVVSNPVKVKSRDTVDCQCECGKTKPVRVWGLITGQVKSCGCLQREYVASFKRTA